MLDWDSSYEIVRALMEAYPDADVETFGLADLCRMIIALPDFADDPLMVNDGILRDILREWYEESTNEWK
ncbi:MAG: Fe-S cluster assembly protein IscX [Anaerolineae bacterium]|jgi:FeS assembly protein IscX|nr:Fe-S cluster assembly protein IscX [Anaerolineae bacterium]